MVEQTKEIWGVASSHSGSMVVTLKQYSDNAARRPHIIIDLSGTEQADNIRYQMCLDVANYLNGHKRPLWLDDMYRKSEVELIGCDNSSIIVVGPFYDSNPPHYNWKECQDDESINARARLVDKLCNIK